MKKKLGSFLLLCLVATLGISLTSCSGFSVGTHNATSHETSTSETVEPPLGDNPDGDSSSSSESQKEDETPNTGSSTDTEDPGQSGDTQDPNEDDEEEDNDDDEEEDDEDDDDTPIVTYTISFASSSYEFEIDETLDLSGEVTCTASDQSLTTYTLSVSNPSFTVSGYTISASEATSAIVTATCDQDTSVKATASITATPLPEPVIYTISFASTSYEFEIDETLDLSGEITCTASDNSAATYTLSVDNSSFIVEGYTISASQATSATVTATCDQDTSVKATASITATPLPEPEPEPDPEPDPGEETVTTYKIGAYSTTANTYYYLTGNNSGSDVETTTSWDSAADFYIDEVSGGYTLSTIKNNSTYYIYYSGSGTSLSMSTTKFTWVYDSTYDTYRTAASGGRFIGNQSGFTYIRCYNVSSNLGSDNYYPAHAYVSSTESQETPSTEGDKTYTLTYTLNSSNSLPSDITGYSTGGFASETYSNYTFEMYRGVALSNYFIKILAEVGNANTASTLPGMLLNTTGFYDIAKIELTYKTSTNSYKQKTQEVPHIYYGNTNSYGYTYDLSTSSSDKTVTIDTEGSNIQFFCLSTTYYDVSISSLSVYYNSGSKASWATSSCGTDQKRIEPVRYSGTPVANSSSVKVPVDVTYNSNGTYTVNSYKTLTYDTYDSAYAAKRTTNAYTDPVDVAAYFIAFGTYPCNYVENSGSNYSTAYSVFGDKTRFWSYYTRTNGYATSVPYRSAKYYELDIALTSNYTKSSTSYSRGVGRLVCWIDGFNDYSTYPVVTYTDDHYYTFKEYYNDGTFGLNFNAEGKVTPYVYGYPTTIS